MNTFSLMFSPNKVMSGSAATIMVVGQIVMALLFWTFVASAVVPTPIEVVDAFFGLWSNGFAEHWFTSFILCLEAVAITTVISLGVSYLTVLPFFRPIATFLSKGRFLSLMGFTFIFTLLVTGHKLKLMLLVYGMSVFFITSMVSVIKDIPKADFDYARTLRLSEARAVWEIVIRGRQSNAIELIRQNFAIGWMMLPMIEGIARAEGGIGTVLLNSNKHFLLADVFAIQLTILLTGLFIDYMIGLFNQAVSPWAFLQLERK